MSYHCEVTRLNHQIFYQLLSRENSDNGRHLSTFHFFIAKWLAVHGASGELAPPFSAKRHGLRGLRQRAVGLQTLSSENRYKLGPQPFRAVAL